MRRSAVLAVLVVTIGGLAACGEDVAPGSSANVGGTSPSRGAGTEVTGSGGVATGAISAEYQGVGMVWETGEHGPQLCLGAILFSHPPGCGGGEVDLVGWDWTGVDDVASVNATTWGTYAVTGTWDGERMTVTRVDAPEDAVGQPPAEEQDLTTPCEPPAGGWAVIDADTATDEAMQRVLKDAGTEPDYAGAWTDQSVNPAYGDGTGNETYLNDPTKLVLNVMFTGDLPRHEAELRGVWGGALCVSSAPRSKVELDAIQSAMTSEPGVLATDPNNRTGTVEIFVIIDDGRQARFDAEYGAGVVVVIPRLVPVG